MVAGPFRDLDLGHPVPDGRGPLIRFATDEAVEFVEAGACRPTIGRTRGAELPYRRLVRFAERAGRIAVQAQHFGEGGGAVGSDASVALEGGRGLGDRTHVADVVIAAGEQGRSGWRAKRRRVEFVEAESVVRQALDGRHTHRAATG